MLKFAPRKRLAFVVLVAGASAALLAACGSDPSTQAEGATINVTSTDDACMTDATQAPAGTLRFVVQNTGTQATEVYVLSGDGNDILGEVEDIGPGLSRDLRVDAVAGDYKVRCKPGMAGDGIDVAFTVTG